MGRSETKPRRSWWQFAARAMALAAVLAGAAYVTLPFWLPTDYLKDQIAKQLAAQTQLEVTIDELTVSWASGLELSGLEIRSPGDNSPMAMVSVRRIGAEFNPIAYFLSDSIEWLEISEPSVFVDIDDRGNLNLAALGSLKSDVQTKRISVHQGRVTVRISGSDEVLQMTIAGAEYVAGQGGKLGRMTVSATLHQADVLAPISMRLSGGDQQAIAAKAVMNFSHLDLARLPLIDLLDLPLAGLDGECRGSLDLSMNHQGVVEQFVLDLSISGLDVRPLNGLELPVIDDAGLHLAAAYDPVKGNLDIQSASIRLPGIDLSGSGSVFSDLGKSHLQAVKKLDLSGTIYPDRIMALMPHKLSMPGELKMSGPVSVGLGIKLENNLFDLTGSFDAAKTEVTLADKVIKPLGREFAGSIFANVDRRNWRMTIKPGQGRVTLGGNSLQLEGTVDDVRGLAAIVDSEPDPAAIIGAIRLVSGSGELEISELESLASVLEIINGRELESIQLKGLITGSLAIHRQIDTVFAASINVPADTELLIGDLLTKRTLETDSPWSVRLDGRIDSGESAIRDATLTIKAANGRIALRDGMVSFAGDAGGGVTASASLQADNIESLLAISPYLHDALGDSFAGGLTGSSQLVLTEDSSRLAIGADLSGLTIRAGDAFIKPVGDKCDVAIKYTGLSPLHQGIATLDASVDFEKARLDADIAISRIGEQTDEKFRAVVKVSDPVWLIESSPAVAALLEQVDRDRLSGSIEFAVSAAGGDGLDANATLRAKGLTFLLKGAAQPCVVDGLLKASLLTSAWEGDVSLTGQIDWTDLSVNLGDTLVKPADLPAKVDFNLSVSPDNTRVRLDSLVGYMGGLELSAVGEASLVAGERSGETRIKLSTDDMGSLAKFAPGLAGKNLSGQASMECDLVARVGQPLLVSSARLKANDVRGNVNGKDVRIDGQLGLEDVSLGQKIAIGRIETTDLELQAGTNHCWLTADLTDLSGDTSGEFVLLAEMLDDKDLSDWFGDADESEAEPDAKSTAGDIPYRRLSDDEKAGLRVLAGDLLEGTKPFLTRMNVSGRVSIGCLRTYDPSVARFYDVSNVEIEASLSDGHLKLGYVAGMNGGTMRDNYEVQLNDPSPMLAYSSIMDDVVATENIQPQLAKFFPGNTVGGLFNRNEKATIPLVDKIANIIEHNYPLHPVGKARTVTTDGVIEGRGAPKFVTRVFPGLNLTKYRYKTMTSFATFRPGGIAENDMVFSGSVHDLYIEGTTDIDNIGRYQVGLILLGTPQSAEWNHRYKQGRIPVLKLKARIEGGKMHDEVVSYPWPNESLFVVFLKNNIFYRIWLESRKTQ